MRDRLIELLDKAFLESDDNYGRPNTDQVADHILANGVLLPPVKIGQTVYQTDGARIYESCITHIEIYSFVTVFYTDGVAFDETAIGKSIYLTKEEAETALAERSGE